MKVLVAGDFRSSKRTVKFIKEGNLSPILGDIVPLTQSVDYAIVNYEAPVTQGNYEPIKKMGPSLRSSELDVKAVKYAGFDMVTLANNHILDYGELGLKDTVEVCAKNGLDVVGVGRDIEEASEIFYTKINGEVLAIINCCEHEFSVATDFSAGANPLDPVKQYYQIQKARENADYVLVIVHGGHEYYQLPSIRMVDTYRFFIDAGADAVINHHQHCFSGYEVYRDKPIVYGLGNFCYDAEDQRDSLWNEGYVVLLAFEEGDSIGMDIVPYIQNNERAGVFLLKDRTLFDKKILHLNEIIADRKMLVEKQDEYYKSQITIAKSSLEPYANRVLLALRRRKLIPSLLSEKVQYRVCNMIECESHRDKLLYALHRR